MGVKRLKRKLKKSGSRRLWLWIPLGILAAGLVTVAVLNGVVVSVGGQQLVSAEAAAQDSRECIVVFGAGVREDGTLSDMLADRMDTGIALYHAGAGKKLLLSGDHGSTEYNEVGAMRDYAVAAGVPETDIFLDHAGFSTYETLRRAQDIFGVSSAVLVTQEYHLYRALYIADALELDAVGVGADRHTYWGQWYREVREIAARNKDFFTCLFWPEPTYWGESIAISGDGRVSWDDAEAI